MCHQTPSHVMMFAGQKRPGRRNAQPPYRSTTLSPNDVGVTFATLATPTPTYTYTYLHTERDRASCIHTLQSARACPRATSLAAARLLTSHTLHTTGTKAQNVLAAAQRVGGPLQRDDDGGRVLSRTCAVAHPEHVHNMFSFRTVSTVRLSMGKFHVATLVQPDPEMLDFQKWISVPPRGRRRGGGWWLRRWEASTRTGRATVSITEVGSACELTTVMAGMASGKLLTEKTVWDSRVIGPSGSPLRRVLLIA